MYTSQDLLKDIIKEAVIDVISERRIGTVWKPNYEKKKRPMNATDVERDKIPPVPEKKEIPKKNDVDNSKDSKIILYKRLKSQVM